MHTTIISVYTAGAVSIDQMVEGLKLLGFDVVFDTNFAADLTVSIWLHTRTSKHDQYPSWFSPVDWPPKNQDGHHNFSLNTRMQTQKLQPHASLNQPSPPPKKTHTHKLNQIMEEGSELLARVKGEPGAGPLPMFTSCCPGAYHSVCSLTTARHGGRLSRHPFRFSLFNSLGLSVMDG
jgi:hypothetical protein